MDEPKWVAGWNLPGCIPEMEPATFDTLAEARAFIAEEREFASEQMEHGDTDPYEYWIAPLFDWEV